MNLQWRWAALKNGFLDATAYRLEFLIEILGSALVPAAIQWVLWYALYQVGGHTEIAGMNFQDMIHYTWMSILFSQVRGGNHDFELAELIRNGQLSNYLLRPVGPVEFVYIRGVAPRLFVAGSSLCVGMFLSLALGTSVLRLLVAMAIALLGNIIHYQIGAVLATAAFYWEEAYSILMIKNLAVSVLSGELLPLTLVPESWSWIWKSTPFYLYVFGPVQIALGKWSVVQIWQSVAAATVWILVLNFAIQASWALGKKRYLSLGG